MAKAKLKIIFRVLGLEEMQRRIREVEFKAFLHEIYAKARQN